jgi:hypothetical protein
VRRRLYEWLADKLGWAYRFDSDFYLGPEYLQEPLYVCRAAFFKQISEIQQHFLDEGATSVDVLESAIDVFTEQGGRRVVRMRVVFEAQPRQMFKYREEPQ